MNEFEVYRLKENLNKCYIISKYIFLFNIVFLITDVLVGFFYKFTLEPNYLLASFYTLLVIALIPFTYIVKRTQLTLCSISKLKVLYLIFIIFIYSWGMSISLMLLLFTSEISPYIIITLALSSFVQLNKKESFIVFFPYNLSFIGILIFFLCASNFVCDNIVPIFFTNIIAYMITTSNYNYSKACFLINSELTSSKYALEKINEELKNYDKSRTNFFTNISHELKTPVNVIYGAQQLLDIQFSANTLDIEKCKKYNAMIKQNSFRLIRLINNILDLSKMDGTVYEIKKENVDIIEAVENIVSSVTDFVEEKGINIIFDTDVEEKIIAVDPDKLERIILNLISNSIKFTDKDGSIFISIHISHKYVFVSVKDTGIGIDESHQSVIFDRFAQIDDSLSRNAEGTGIGLALVKNLMHLHNGDITLTSSLGNGSDFTLKFPNIKLDMNDNSCYQAEYKDKAYKNKIERIEIEFSDIYK